MPIRPENRARYPRNWKQISAAIRERAANKCEWCGARNGEQHPVTGSKVVLTTAHLDHTPEHNDPSNLASLCQRCHNRYDAPVRRAGIRERQLARVAIRDLLADVSLEMPPAPGAKP